MKLANPQCHCMYWLFHKFSLLLTKQETIWNMLGGLHGFNVRIDTTNVVDGVMTQTRMVCSKQGYYSPTFFHDETIPQKKCRIHNTRTGCEPMIYIILDDLDLGKWCVASFVS